MNAIHETITHITDMYKAFNKELEAQLPEDVVFSLIPNHNSRSKYFGWFAQKRWVQGEQKIHEINIAPDFLNRPVDQIAETIIHEIVHLKNNINGIEDTTPNQYHKRSFKKQAEAFGLKVEKMRNKGYALTALDEKAQKMVDNYKTNVLKGANPFIIHRMSDIRLSKASDKRTVAINKDLAEEVESLCGKKLGSAVRSILTEWIQNNIQKG